MYIVYKLITLTYNYMYSTVMYTYIFLIPNIYLRNKKVYEHYWKLSNSITYLSNRKVKKKI